jgi:hypothetical protein
MDDKPIRQIPRVKMFTILEAGKTIDTRAKRNVVSMAQVLAVIQKIPTPATRCGCSDRQIASTASKSPDRVLRLGRMPTAVNCFFYDLLDTNDPVRRNRLTN